jgi:putative flippase GtrA
MIQFLTFASIGIWNTLFDILLWKALLFLKIPQKLRPNTNPLVLAQYISLFVASSFSFFLNLFFTFKTQNNLPNNLFFTGCKFVIVTSFFLWFSGAIIKFLQIKFPTLKQMFYKLITVAFILPLSYLAYKFWVYT